LAELELSLIAVRQALSQNQKQQAAAVDAHVKASRSEDKELLKSVKPPSVFTKIKNKILPGKVDDGYSPAVPELPTKMGKMIPTITESDRKSAIEKAIKDGATVIVDYANGRVWRKGKGWKSDNTLDRGNTQLFVQ
jgi:hypothetical protein